MDVLFIGGPMHLRTYPVSKNVVDSGRFMCAAGENHPESQYTLLLTPGGAVQLIGVCDDDQSGVEIFLRLIAGNFGLHIA